MFTSIPLAACPFFSSCLFHLPCFALPRLRPRDVGHSALSLRSPSCAQPSPHCCTPSRLPPLTFLLTGSFEHIQWVLIKGGHLVEGDEEAEVAAELGLAPPPPRVVTDVLFDGRSWFELTEPHIRWSCLFCRACTCVLVRVPVPDFAS